MNTQEYFKEIEEKTLECYSLANEARKKNLDPKPFVEVPLAKSMAEKVVALISTIYPQMDGSGIVERILNLEEKYGKLDPMVAFKIAEEVSKQKFCKFSSLIESIDAGIRIGFAYLTLGVVSSPIEGFTGVFIRKTKEGKEYLAASFSGPIRSAGTTASCLVLMLIDYLRELFGYDKYDASDEEIKRYWVENQDYHERVTNLQYMPTKEEAFFLAENIPIQIDGDPTEKIEVSNYKNLERIKTNYVRGGMCLIFSEGLAQKAAKGLRLLKKMKERGLVSEGFDFLDKYLLIHEKKSVGKIDESPTYIKDIVAGRPIFGYPSRSGGFRFRYGRGRNSGFSAVSIHPATMGITDKFIAIGTQLKIEKPTKGCITTVCDLIDGPIVKLKNQSVKKIKTLDEAKTIYEDVEEIIYLGDILFPYSDVVNRNAKLIKPGYVEEIWRLELREKNPSLEKKINCFDVDIEEAIKISRENKISLHPEYIFYWNQINIINLKFIFELFSNSRFEKKLIIPYGKSEKEKFIQGKRGLELLGIEHDVFIENIVIDKKNSQGLLSNLGVDYSFLEKENFLKEHFLSLIEKLNIFLKNNENSDLNEGELILKFLNSISEFEIRDKAGEFIGSRMGRPEKAKLRKLVGSPNILFPVGKEGGRLRSFQSACDIGFIKNSFPIYNCCSCGKETIFVTCEKCGGECKKMFYCFECKEKFSEPCKKHEKSTSYCFTSLDISNYFEKARANLDIKKEEMPVLIKGIRNVVSENRIVEHLEKGILRAMHNLQVNKDGTIRFDFTEMPLVSFKPKEVFVSIESLKKNGYLKDIYGKELVSEEQILELKPHDIILPLLSGPTERIEDSLMNVCDFIDQLLLKFYKKKSFYNVKKREDMVGQIGVLIAPHNCAGVICRVIGFSNVLGISASPYMHAAIRRDCDGDEAAFMFLMDVLLNFSKEFLPGHRGATQDCPLVLNSKINAGEVDDQILDFELVEEYPLELYKLADEKKHSSELKIYDVRAALKDGKDPFVEIGFTHDTSDINDGVLCSNYKILATMQEKVQRQMELVEKIRATDTSDTARLILDRHFIRDMKGNLRNFSVQTFRCVACNEIMRRPPLSGVCLKCKGKLIFTTHEGGIKKYLEPALNIAKKYNLSEYMLQNLELTKSYIDSVFGIEIEKQENLGKWF